VSGVGLIVLTKLLVPLLGPSGFLSSFDPVLAASPIIVAFAVSLVIGLVAGGYPAWRAAQLNPIEGASLRVVACLPKSDGACQLPGGLG